MEEEASVLMLLKELLLALGSWLRHPAMSGLRTPEGRLSGVPVK